MKITSFICLVSCICLFACQNSPKESTATYDVGLVESKKIVLPVDENTYYLSKSMFQFEEDDKEYLQFGNFEKRQHEILIYDIESESLHKRIPFDASSKPFSECGTMCSKLTSEGISIDAIILVSP